MRNVLHPTYGNLENFLRELKSDILEGYYIRPGQISALQWYSEQFSQLKQDKHDLDEVEL